MSHPSHAAAASRPSLGPVQFSPLPGVLPPVTLWPVHRGEVRIGDATYLAYLCPSTGSAFAVVRPDFVSTQAGAMSIAAVFVRDVEDAKLKFRTPYALVAIKWEDKARFHQQQVRLAAGKGGDHSMLDKSLCMHLAERAGPAAAYLPRLHECWHDESRIYSVLDYHPSELRAVISAAPKHRLDESTARRYTRQLLEALRALHGAGWCHRDISPENILVSADGARAVLIDFGTATLMPRAGASARSSQSPGAGGGEGAAVPPSSARAAFTSPAAATPSPPPPPPPVSRSLHHTRSSSDSSFSAAAAAAPGGHPRGTIRSDSGGSTHSAPPPRPWQQPSHGTADSAALIVGLSDAESSSEEDEGGNAPVLMRDDDGGAAPSPSDRSPSDGGSVRRRITGPQRSLRPRRPFSPATQGSGSVLSAAAGGRGGTGSTFAYADADMSARASPRRPPSTQAVTELLLERGLPQSLGPWGPLAPPPADGLFCKPAYACPYYLWRRPYFGASFDLWSVGATLFCMLEGGELYRTPVPGLDAAFSLLWDSEAALLCAEEEGGAQGSSGGAAGEEVAWLRQQGGGGARSTGGAAPAAAVAAAGRWRPLSHPPGSSATHPVQLSAEEARHSSRVSANAPVGGLGGVAASTPRTRFEQFLDARNAARVSAGDAPLSAAALDLLLRLLRVRPQYRPITVEDALAHPWFDEGRPAAAAGNGHR